MENGKWRGEEGEWKRESEREDIFPLSTFSTLHSPLSILHSPFSTLHSPLSNLHSPIPTFLGDRRGTSLVTYTLVLPFLLLLIFGATTVWRVISIKQSMDLVTYEATRYLAREGRDFLRPYDDIDQWVVVAREQIEDAVVSGIRRNPFIDEGDEIHIEIVGPANPDCNARDISLGNRYRALDDIRFTVTTNLTLDSPIQIPYLSTWTFTVRESHSDLIECPRFRQDPPDEKRSIWDIF